MACGLRTPETVEAEHVHRVYDEIAPHFSHTRYKPWPKVAAFLARLPANSIVADIGTFTMQVQQFFSKARTTRVLTDH